MSFSSLVSNITYRDSDNGERASQFSRAKSYTSTTATSVSISGDISSQLHGGYFHPLARAWQAERQLTKVISNGTFFLQEVANESHIVYVNISPLHIRST